MHLIENVEEIVINEITEKIIGAAIEVHKALGPGLFEATYEACLYYELINAKLKVDKQKVVPLVYKNIEIENGFRLDLIVEDKVIIEIKAVENITKVHEVQLFSYLKHTGCKVGLLINFNVDRVVNGIKRILNGYYY